MAERPGSTDIPLAVKRTRLAGAVLGWLEETRRAVVSSYVLFLALRGLYTPENRRRLYLKSDVATTENLRRVTTNLLRTRAIELDPDYGRSVYKVLSLGEVFADEVCALVNPFCYISHLSAMQRWGLTERRPEALYLTQPPASQARTLIEQKMLADYGVPFANLPLGQAVKLHFVRHPQTVRGRKISVHQTKTPGQWLQVRDSHVRLATVGQTFLDTLEHPQYCGGMAHVIDVWRAHANTYREEIIATVDEFAAPIAKVRAGYLLDEMLGLGDDQRIQGWVRFAQRGSARVLDPARDFNTDHSEKWMLSINA